MAKTKKTAFRYYHLLSIQEIVAYFQKREYRFNLRLFNSWVSKGLVPKTYNGFFLPDILNHIEKIFELRGKGWSLDEIRKDLEDRCHTLAFSIPALFEREEKIFVGGNDDLIPASVVEKFPVEAAAFQAWVSSRRLLTQDQITYSFYQNSKAYLEACLAAVWAINGFLDRFNWDVYQVLPGDCGPDTKGLLDRFLEEEKGSLKILFTLGEELYKQSAEFLTKILKTCFKIRKGLGFKIGKQDRYITEGLRGNIEDTIEENAIQEIDDLIKRIERGGANDV